MWLDVMNGQILCSECLKKRTGNLPLPEVDAYNVRNVLIPLDVSALASMRYACAAPLSRIFAFSLRDEGSLALFAKACESYLLHHLERSFDTLDFYRTVQ